MTQTKADRSNAAKKAAATRKRNEAKAQAAATSQAKRTAVEARDSTGSAVGSLVNAAKSAGDPALRAGKSTATCIRGRRRGTS